MPPGGFYLDFLHRYVPFGAVKNVGRSVLFVAKLDALEQYRTVCFSLLPQKVGGVDFLRQHPRIAIGVIDWLLGPKQNATLSKEVAGGGVHTRPKLHKRNAHWLGAQTSAGVALVIRSVLDPLWRSYAADVSPGLRPAPGVPLVPHTQADFASLSLPLRYVDMVRRRLSSQRVMSVLSGGRAQWKHETRKGSDIGDAEPFSVHTNAAGLTTSDGGESVCAGTIERYSKRIHCIMGRAFPAEPNPNEVEFVMEARKSARRVKGAFSAVRVAVALHVDTSP